MDKNQYKLVSSSDTDFPLIPPNISEEERPTLLAYMGDLGLLSQIEINVAVVGVLSPDNAIYDREKSIVALISKKGRNIISGLAVGCDTIAHETALQFGAKTIAFLPSTLQKIYPKRNEELARKIVAAGGLVLTEYTTEPSSRWEMIKRFIERDRLQAMFASKVILIASFRSGEGDSGSRHCMQKAKAYGIQRYVLYNHETDRQRAVFGLNADLCEKGATILTNSSAEDL